MNAFVTGSRAYGTPTPESDIDLCVQVTNAEMNLLAGLSDTVKGSTPESLCFGKLNLLIFPEEWKFRVWRRVTDQLIAKKPVTREEAVAAFESAEKDELAKMKGAATCRS